MPFASSAAKGKKAAKAEAAAEKPEEKAEEKTEAAEEKPEEKPEEKTEAAEEQAEKVEEAKVEEQAEASADPAVRPKAEGPPAIQASGVLVLSIIVFGFFGWLAAFASLLSGMAIIDPETRAMLVPQPQDVVAGLCAGLPALFLWGPVYGLLLGALVAITGISGFLVDLTGMIGAAMGSSLGEQPAASIEESFELFCRKSGARRALEVSTGLLVGFLIGVYVGAPAGILGGVLGFALLGNGVVGGFVLFCVVFCASIAWLVRSFFHMLY